MKMQFAFGNPRRGSKRKKVAKRRKKLKTKSVKKKFHKVGKVGKSKRRRKLRKNPAVAVVKKGGKIAHRGFSSLSKREEDTLRGKIAKAKAAYSKAPSASNAKAAAFRELAGLVKQAKSKLSNREAYLKTLKRYAEEGASIKEYDLAAKGKKVAKKKRKKKKSPKASAKKVRRTKKRKGGKRRKMSKKAKKAFVARMKKARKGKSGKKRHSKKRRHKHAKKAAATAPKKHRAKRRKGSKRRRRARMISHKHASSTRHIKRGTSFKFKSKSRRGKRSISISGRVKVNPYRSNPMKQVSAQMKKALGLDAAELGSLALGGALVPIVNAGIGKIPGMSAVVSKINSVAGAQATGSIIPILVGALLNLGADKASGQAKQYMQMAGEGLAAAGVIGLVMGLSQKYVTPALGLSGINFTPGMRGVNFTPNMGIMPQLNGVNFTPNMGIMPQLNGVDFGSANYGGGGGSKEARTQRSDFGANWSEDSEAEGLEDQENSYSSSMN